MRQRVGTARTEAFRQARPLAEGQKSADVKHDFIVPPPPPPTKTVGGGGRISREKCRFSCLRAVIWRRGSPGRRCHSIGGDFEPYRISDYVLEGGSLKSIITWLLLGLLYGGFGLVAYHVLARRAEAGKGMPAYSMYSREREGLAEFARLLEKLGYEA